MTTNPTQALGIQIGTVDTVSLVPINVANLTSNLGSISATETLIANNGTTISAQAVLQGTTIAAVQATGTTLTGLLVVGNTITATMTNDLASMMTGLTAISNENSTIQAQATLLSTNVSSLATQIGAATTITGNSNAIIQYDPTVVNHISILNGALLATLTFASAQSLLPP